MESISESFGSMGKLVNPFASHAKDPQFEPGWNHFDQVNFFAKYAFDSLFLFLVTDIETIRAIPRECPAVP
jgi:hypothetical protein